MPHIGACTRLTLSRWPAPARRRRRGHRLNRAIAEESQESPAGLRHGQFPPLSSVEPLAPAGRHGLNTEARRLSLVAAQRGRGDPPKRPKRRVLSCATPLERGYKGPNGSLLAAADRTKARPRRSSSWGRLSSYSTQREEWPSFETTLTGKCEELRPLFGGDFPRASLGGEAESGRKPRLGEHRVQGRFGHRRATVRRPSRGNPTDRTMRENGPVNGAPLAAVDRPLTSGSLQALGSARNGVS
jgi:hypothetical protein